MSTVDLTPEKNNGPQRLTKSQRRLERLLKMAGKHALTSKKNYSHYKNVLDFMQDEEGNDIESAPHPQQIVQIRMKEPVAENFILRKRKGQADC